LADAGAAKVRQTINNATDLSSVVYFNFNFNQYYPDKNTQFIDVPQISRTGNSDVTEKALNCTASLLEPLAAAISHRKPP